MKKALSLLLVLIMCLSLCACGSKAISQETIPPDTALPQANEMETAVSAEDETEPTALLANKETAHCRLEGIYVDNSYADGDNTSLKMVYVFYTAFTNDQNLSICSKYSELGFESGNSYSSEYHSKSCCDYIPNYYASNYLEDIYIGESLKVVSTFLVPYAEFERDGLITVQPYGIPYEERLAFSSEDVQFFESADSLAQAIDPEGYAEIVALHQPADEQTCAKVKKAINGYYWSFYVNSTSYVIEFWAPNKFEVRVKALGITNGGTYTIQKGYVVCTYDSNGASVEIPYSWGTDDIDLNLPDAFDVSM